MSGHHIDHQSIMANDSVTSDKLADGAIRSEHVADESVTSDKLAQHSITGEKIANHSIGPEKLNFNPFNMAQLGGQCGTHTFSIPGKGEQTEIEVNLNQPYTHTNYNCCRHD